VRGVTQPLVVEGATITYIDGSVQTQSLADGDLLQLRATFEIELGDHAVNNPLIGSGNVASTVPIELTTYMSTVPPGG